jgi:hypothetical protein
MEGEVLTHGSYCPTDRVRLQQIYTLDIAVQGLKAKERKETRESDVQTSAARSKNKRIHIFGALRRRNRLNQAIGRHVLLSLGGRAVESE